MARRGLPALAAMLAASAALAQAPLPEDAAPTEGREKFRVCRAAVYYHLSSDPDPRSVVSLDLAASLRDQIVFIMSETLRSAPASDIKEAARVISFAEKFFLSFAETLSSEREALSDIKMREAVLLDCVPFVWTIMRDKIEYLMQWRNSAIPQPVKPPPGEAR